MDLAQQALGSKTKPMASTPASVHLKWVTLQELQGITRWTEERVEHWFHENLMELHLAWDDDEEAMIVYVRWTESPQGEVLDLQPG